MLNKLLNFRNWLKKHFDMSHERFVKLDDAYKEFVYKQYEYYLDNWREERGETIG